jgi:hypothetical protein
MKSAAEKSQPRTTDSTGSEKVRYRVMAPVYREGREKPFWLRLGTAFENAGKNGGPPSITVKLDAAPYGGELVLFEDEDRSDAE